MTFSLYQGDAIEALQTLPDESVDLIITDTAYESLEKHRKVGTTTRLKHSKSSSNDWFPIFPNARFPQLFAECWRVLKRDTHFYFHCDAETMFVAKPMAEAAGFKFWKPLVFDKITIGMGYHYRCQTEFILFFEKGKRKLNDLSIPDIFHVPRVRNGYPTEKPLEISTTLVKQSSAPGQIVLDPFCGSGGVGVAALQCDRHFLGVDISEKAYLTSQAKMCAAGGAQRSWENLLVRFRLVSG
jgi:site-specific DNA-methyltransferase (adenine-specific)